MKNIRAGCMKSIWAWETPDLNHVHFCISVPSQGEAYVVLPKDKQKRTYTLRGETLDITYETDGAIGVRRSITDITDDFKYDTAQLEAFFVPAGTAVEL